MNKIWIIARKDISEAFRSRSTYVFILVMIVLTFIYISIYTGTVNSNPYKNNPSLIAEYSHNFLDTLAYLFAVDVLQLYLFYFCQLRGHCR